MSTPRSTGRNRAYVVIFILQGILASNALFPVYHKPVTSKFLRNLSIHLCVPEDSCRKANKWLPGKRHHYLISNNTFILYWERVMSYNRVKKVLCRGLEIWMSQKLPILCVTVGLRQASSFDVNWVTKSGNWGAFGTAVKHLTNILFVSECACVLATQRERGWTQLRYPGYRPMVARYT